MSARSRRSCRMAGSAPPASRRASAGAIVPSISAGRPERQSSQGKNSYQSRQRRLAPHRRLAHQGEIGDRDLPGAAAALAGIAVAVAEGVELLDVAQSEAGLLAHPAAQAAVERAVVLRLERAEGQGLLGRVARSEPRGTP